MKSLKIKYLWWSYFWQHGCCTWIAFEGTTLTGLILSTGNHFQTNKSTSKHIFPSDASWHWSVRDLSVNGNKCLFLRDCWACCLCLMFTAVFIWLSKLYLCVGELQEGWGFGVGLNHLTSHWTTGHDYTFGLPGSKFTPNWRVNCSPDRFGVSPLIN